MADSFHDPDSLFEEFEKEPVSQFNPSITNGVNSHANNGHHGDDDNMQMNGGSLLFKTPEELLEDAPGIQLTFLNHSKFLKHRSAIERFFAQILDWQADEKDDDESSSLPEPLPTSANLAPPGCNNSAPWRTTGCLQLFAHFILDAHGHPLVQSTHELTTGWDIPPFERLFEKYIPQDEEEGLVPKGTRRGRSCFNCGEESHAIADCPLPKNMKEIQRRKAEIRKATNVPTLSGNKATLDVSVDPRFKDCKPGSIGEELRSALGLGGNKMPPWIYRMRMLGYPPGWLEEAKLTYSGLTMFEGDGERLRSDGLRIESGEVEEQNFEEEKEFQLQKLVAYPGFNVPPPERIQDEGRRYQAPPFDRNQSLDYMRSDFARRNENLKRQLGVEKEEENGDDAPTTPKRQRTMDQDAEMEISSGDEHQFRPPLPPGAPPPATPPGPLPSSTPPSTPRSISSNASSIDGPRSSVGSQSGMEEEFSDGIIVEDELEDGEVSLEDGEMPPTPPPNRPSSAPPTEDVAEISYEVPPMSPTTPIRPSAPINIPTTPVSGASADPRILPESPSVSLNSISMEHSTPIPSRWDVSRFLGEDDDDYGEDEEEDNAASSNGQAEVGKEDENGDEEAAATPTTPSTRRRKFIVQDPCVNPAMPTPDQWADGVSEHMDFENLPNTEGRYSRIKEIAERRKKLNSRKKL